MKISRLFYLYVCSCLPFLVIAQNEANIWHFGYGAGLDFNGGAPVSIDGGQINHLEGCASISDKDGNLLFYSDGITVWDVNHNPTPNGFGLLGNPSSTQSAIIVQKPLSDSIYYIFTVAAFANPDGLRYSEFDVSLNGGLGDVTGVKNVPLETPTCEKVTAVRHDNCKDIWVLTRGFGNDRWVSYLVDENGVNAVPVVSNIGVTVTNGVDGIGYMKASPDGNRVAAVYDYSNFPAEVLDFDATTGLLSNLLNLTVPSVGFGPYGVEFSPNSQVLYIGLEGANQYSQFDLAAMDIQASEQIFTIPGATSLGAFQLGPDQKIYIAQSASSDLSVIGQPDLIGPASDLQPNAIDLSPNSSGLGLPTFFPDILSNVDFVFDPVCYGDSTLFVLSSECSPDSVLWNFDDPASGAENISVEFNPTHVFTDPGLYEVTLIRYRDTIIDTIMRNVTIHPIPEFNLGEDTLLCEGEILTLGSDLPVGDYIWQDSSMNQIFTVDSNGEYHVTVSANMCQFSDTIVVIYVDPPQPDLGIDTSFCEGDSLLLNPGDYSEYVWQDGSEEAIFEVDNSGNYSVVVTDSNGCVGTDMIVVGVNPLPIIDLGVDTTICSGETLVLDAQIPGGIYLWQDSSVSSTLEVDESGTYSVEVLDANGCQNEDEMELFLSEVIGTFEGTDLLCFGDSSGIIEGDFIDEDSLDYNWSGGQMSADLENLSSGVYDVVVTNGDGCEYDTTIVIDEPDLLNMVGSMEDVLCFGESNGLITIEKVLGGTSPYMYSINNGAFTSEMIFSGLGSGAYSVIVRDSNGCEALINFNINEPADIILDIGADTIIDLGESYVFDVFLSSPAGVLAEWLSSELISCVDCLEPSVIPTESGEYILTVIDTANGCEKRDTIFIQVNPRDEVYVPNAFSPNGDGTNDRFYPYGDKGVLRVNKMNIYNRWGELVFEAQNFEPGDPQYGWDGRFKGQEVSNGVYVYFIQLIMANGSSEHFVGDVNVIR